ncbi:GNAT family N-acetyltransferase [Bacillus sp. FJAT-27986]|uniref:GNAT family N-acetyltransferase n=1 Tax=Bacillus sp. FJAT-27986 TaxID=1743146 RepID=UPI00080AD53D|nr:GNAT family N-acetyltransferase [Bacillus sp. FJAT-27986]OCA81750.1 GNAT family acetyltransferase [Bacillus sp. FJAT-27986]
MIKRLSEKDHDVCVSFIHTKPSENLFLIGDIEAYGYEEDFQKVWGEFDTNGNLIAVLLKYIENYIPYAENDLFDAKGFADIMLNDPEFSMMSGLKEVTENIDPYLQQRLLNKRQTFYAKCQVLNAEAGYVDTTEVQYAAPDDAERIVKLLQNIPEFKNSCTSVEEKRKSLKDGFSRCAYITDNGKVVSSASTTAENSCSAMVVAVATLGDYKKKGYATKCMVKLCKQLLSEGKEICLFYDNPNAGVIYKRIGFADIGYWMMYRFKKDKLSD